MVTNYIYFSAFNPPLFAGRRVKGFYVSTASHDTDNCIKVQHVTEDEETFSMLKIAQVTACSGPAVVNMGVKG